MCLLQFIMNFSNFREKFEIPINVLRKKNEENSYQKQNILKKSEIFIIDLYFSV